MPGLVTEEAVRQAYRQGTALDGAILLTVTSSHLAETLRITNREGGIVSNSEEFRFVPFRFEWAGASADQPGRDARLECQRDGLLAEAIRTAPKNTVLAMEVELVRASNPDDVERAFRGATLPTAEASGQTLSFTVRGKNFADEYACSKRYVYARTPSVQR